MPKWCGIGLTPSFLYEINVLLCFLLPRVNIKMNSYKKSDLLEYMWDNDLKPKTEDIEKKLETFLLQQFGILSCDVEDYKKFADDVIDFRRNLRAITTQRGWNKKLILRKHSVGLLYHNSFAQCLKVTKNVSLLFLLFVFVQAFKCKNVIKWDFLGTFQTVCIYLCSLFQVTQWNMYLSNFNFCTKLAIMVHFDSQKYLIWI